MSSQCRRLEVSLPKFYAAVESAVVKRRRTSASLMSSCPFLAIDRRNIKIDAIILRWQANQFWRLMRHTKGVLRYAHDWRH